MDDQNKPGPEMEVPPHIRTKFSPRIDGPVPMKISGCQTLQENLDGKRGSIGDTVIEVSGRGRTVEEICETLGQGCQYCNRVIK